MSNLDLQLSRKLFIEGLKANVFTCYNIEVNKNWRICKGSFGNIEFNKYEHCSDNWFEEEGNNFFSWDAININGMYDQLENVYLFLMINGKIYMPSKRSRGAKFITVNENFHKFRQWNPCQTPQKNHWENWQIKHWRHLKLRFVTPGGLCSIECQNLLICFNSDQRFLKIWMDCSKKISMQQKTQLEVFWIEISNTLPVLSWTDGRKEIPNKTLTGCSKKSLKYLFAIHQRDNSSLKTLIKAREVSLKSGFPVKTLEIGLMKQMW